jgi:MFS family permease
MHKALLNSWPLFFGLLLLMIGNGLQGTLLGVRATLEDFNMAAIGLIMSLYYVGYLMGSIYVPKFLTSVGHIRVFAALASLASATVLLHGIFLNEWLWGIIRIFTGFSYAGLYIVAESWLNNISTNKVRGKVVGIYMFITFGGMVLGQILLNLSDPGRIELFILTSVLVSFALIPISLSSRPVPEFEEPEHVSLKRLYIISPLGLFGAFSVGAITGIMFGIGAVYATDIGMSLGQVSTFMAVYILGGVLFQIPIGWLSDRFDRRVALIAVSFLTGILCIGCYFTSINPGLFLYLTTLLFGGLSLSLYGLCLAHTNDHLTQRQIIGAGSSLILINGAGACLGPILVSGLMQFFGPPAFFPLIFVFCLLIFSFGLLRVQLRDPVPIEEQGDYMAMPVRTTPIVMQIAEESSEIMKEMDQKD